MLSTIVKSEKILVIIFFLAVMLFAAREVLPTEIDDVSPEINCPEIDTYNPDILYVIPDFNNKPISQNVDWCNYISSLNKTLELHGIHHWPYEEFKTQTITQADIDFAVYRFETCFGERPDKFKPPQLAISQNNKNVIERSGLKLELNSYILHKVYHCSDTGVRSNNAVFFFKT